MGGRGNITCWNCRSPTPASRATCLHCGHPLIAAPPGGFAPLGAGPPSYPFPLSPGSPSMRASGAAGARFIAIFVDFFIVALLYFPALLILPAILGTNLWQWNGLFGTVLNILLPSSLFWFYKAGLEMGWSTTVGKRLAGLRVVKGDLSKISSTQALVRNADILLWGVTFALVPLVSWMLVRTKGTSLGDLFAHTYVVPT